MQVPPSNYPRPDLSLDRERLRAIAKTQRNLLFCVLAQFCVIIPYGLAGATQSTVLAFLAFALLILTVVFSIISVYKLATALNELAILYAILMFVPCVSLITLLLLVQKATNRLKQNGVKVGLLGANPDSI